MRRIKPEELGVDLPLGFYLEENEDKVCLFYRGKQAGLFSATKVKPEEIGEI
jgi:hypothetical protein